jgi:hypothetical protein
MTCSKRSFALVFAFFGMFLLSSTGTVDARDTDAASRNFAAAHTAKRQCINACRARYRDCLHQKQLPSFECQNVYQDCTRYTCTGLGPG